MTYGGNTSPDLEVLRPHAGAAVVVLHGEKRPDRSL